MNKLVEAIIKPIIGEQTNIKRVIAVYPGRFQPFGPHHKAAYDFLKKQFDDVYIVTSDIKKLPRHPMNFREKQAHMSKMGIPKSKISKETMPYIPKNLLKKFDSDTTAIVFAVGKKDASRLSSGKYFIDYKKNNNKLEGYKDHGYIFIVPHISVKAGGMEVSGTSMRELLGSPKYKDDRERRFKKMFGYFDKKTFELMTGQFSKIFEQDDVMIFKPTKMMKGKKKWFDGKGKDVLFDLEEDLGWPLSGGQTIGHGYPSEEDMKKIAKKLKKIRSKTNSNKTYQFDPVNEGKVHRSAGIIPYFIENDELKFLLLKNDTGWGFPKGHLEKGETGIVAAKRETKEETGLTINKVHSSFKYTSKYFMRKDYEKGEKLEKPELKFVAFFLGEAPSKSVRLSHEHTSFGWFTVSETKKKLKFGDGKKMFKLAVDVLNQNEDINIPVKVGDTILMGKWKNKKVKIKSIGTDEHGMPTINGKKAATFRIHNIVNIFDNEDITEEQLLNFVKNTDFSDIIKEASASNGAPADDGPRYWWGNQKSYRADTDKQARKLGFNVVNYILSNDEFLEYDTDYPRGPTGAVSYFPVGDVGAKSGTNIKADMRGKLAYKEWVKFIKKIALTAGYKFANFLKAEKSIESSKNEPIKKGDPGDIIPLETKLKGKKDQHKDYEEIKEQALTKEWWKNILLEGGAYGHMAHPFDDKNLTFKDLKEIITMGLGGQLNREDNVTEKLDGQNLMVSWKDGRLIAARNKGHLKNAGETALDAKGVASKFAGRGSVSDAFSFAMKDLEKAIGALAQKQKDKIFMNGKAFMNLEVMWPANPNVIDYDKAEIVFHGALEYNDAGSPIGEVKGSGRILEGMIRQINQQIQKHYKIGKPIVLTIPKHQDFGKKKKMFISRLNKLQKQFGLKDNDTLALYHQMFWENYVYNASKQFKYTLSKSILQRLTRRWAFGDKSYKISQLKKDIKNDKFLDWILATDKIDVVKMTKDNMIPFEKIFFEVGAEILKNVKGFMAANPDKAVQSMRKQLDKAISDIRSGGDITKIKKIKQQLDKISSLGGFKSIVPSEGIVFKYNGNVYKFTGAFAPVNQITGLAKFG